MKHFRFSFIFTLVALSCAAWWGYENGGTLNAIEMIWIAAILGVMEVSLSFDNAVVNAAVLKNWNYFWRTLFLTLGILIAVFGMRLLFPLVIVAFTANIDLLDVWNLALTNPEEYISKKNAHHAEVSAFGSMFLLLVFLYFLKKKKKDYKLLLLEYLLKNTEHVPQLSQKHL